MSNVSTSQSEAPELFYKGRITKTNFTEKLITLFGKDDITQRPHKEFIDGKTSTMSLFYLKGVHVGTWLTREGWIFQHAMPAKHVVADLLGQQPVADADDMLWHQGTLEASVEQLTEVLGVPAIDHESKAVYVWTTEIGGHAFNLYSERYKHPSINLPHTWNVDCQESAFEEIKSLIVAALPKTESMKAPAKVKKESKIDKCRRLYKKHGADALDDTMIAIFAKQCAMSAGQAKQYLKHIRKES